MHTFSRITIKALIAISFGACAASAIAGNDIDARYRAERAVCLSGQSNQDRATCLKEAGAARSEARRHRLDSGQSAFNSNAVLRCNALPADDRADCMRRIEGDGKVSGSVRDGGLLRETTTVVPADPAK